MTTLSLSIRKVDWKQALAAHTLPTEETIRNILESVGLEVIAYLKSKTDERRPPWPSASGPERQAHPGHWADRRGQLVGSYSHQVRAVDGGWRLELRNTAEYALYLELRDGFFVLSGVLDRGGIVMEALADVIPTVAPGMEVDVSRLEWASV